MAFVVGSVIIGGAAALGGAAIASKGAKDAAKTASEGTDKSIAYNRESRDIALDLGSPYREAGYSALDKLGAMTGLVEPGGSFGRPSYQGEGAAVTSEGTPWGDSPWKLGFEDGKYTATLGEDKLFWDDSSESWMSSTGSAYGSSGSSGGKPSGGYSNDFSEGSDNAIYGRAFGGALFNINELGPESVYSRGAITRSSQPRTMPSDPRGYVHPNVDRYSNMVATQRRGASNWSPPSPEMQHRIRSNYANLGGVFANRRTPLIQGRAAGGTMVDPNSMGDSVGLYPNINPGGGASKNSYDMIADAKGGEFGYRDGIPSGKENMSGDTIDVTADVNQPAVGGKLYTGEGGAPTPQENPYDFTTDPGYIFRFNEGMRGLEGSAAARGGLLSGGFGRKAIRYGQDYATGEFTNIYNRLSNIAGLGQVSAGQGGVFAQNAGANMGGAAADGALSSAYGEMGGTNAWSNAFNQIAQLPWDKLPWGGSGNSTGGLPGGKGFN